MKFIDSHHHFWHYTPEEFGWITDDMASIRRDYLPDDLTPLSQAAVSVQARPTLDETRWLLNLAHEHEFIQGVVGWVDLRSDNIDWQLEQFANPKLVGVRHVVQAEPAGFLYDKNFNRGIASLQTFDLVYDILIHYHQLAETIDFVDRHPNQIFVLDHLAKPDLLSPDLSTWKAQLVELARRSNVACKVAAGLIEATPNRWTPEIIRPYLDIALQAFDASRLMFGSNWPLTEAAGGYSRWLTTIQQWAQRLSKPEQAELFGGTATRVYQLDKKQ